MQLEVGQIVEGKITGIKEYGLFADVGEGVSGMVHISEVSRTFVSDIKEIYKIGDTAKMKVLNVGDDGKISLSIKKAMEPEERNGDNRRPRREKKPTPAKPDGSYVWTPQKSESMGFEDMMNRFKQTSDEKFSDLKRKNSDSHRTKRGASR